MSGTEKRKYLMNIKKVWGIGSICTRWALVVVIVIGAATTEEVNVARFPTCHCFEVPLSIVYVRYVCIFVCFAWMAKGAEVKRSFIFLFFYLEYIYTQGTLPLSYLIPHLSAQFTVMHKHTHFLIIKINQGSLEYRAFFVWFSSAPQSLSLTLNIDTVNFRSTSTIFRTFNTLSFKGLSRHVCICIRSETIQMRNYLRRSTILSLSTHSVSCGTNIDYSVSHQAEHCRMPAWSEPFD